jgi:hypothetical protein
MAYFLMSLCPMSAYGRNFNMGNMLLGQSIDPDRTFNEENGKDFRGGWFAFQQNIALNYEKYI